ncbi:hypothetical protein MMC18_000910 [Xylographa bjoerkii]|nr:hypothetical protein [Xylographa bjoerkii]
MWERVFGEAGLVAHEYIIGFIFHSSHWLFLAKIHPPPEESLTKSAKGWFAFKQVFSGRWGIVYLPPFDRKDPQYIPSRSKLFFRRLWDLIWIVGVIYLLNVFKLNLEPEDFVFGDTSFFRRFLDITPRETIIRIYFFIYGNSMAYLGLRGAHSLGTCLAMAYGDDPSRWPPLFGSLREATTVRKWYSLFWHHLMRKAFTAHASFILHNVLRLPRKGPVTRFLIIFLSFMFSAGLHALASPGIELCGMFFQARYYLLVIGAIVCEDLVISAWRLWKYPAVTPRETVAQEKKKEDPNSITKHDTDENGDAVDLLWSLLGFSWVVTFQTLSVSENVFGLYQCYAAQVT